MNNFMFNIYWIRQCCWATCLNTSSLIYREIDNDLMISGGTDGEARMLLSSPFYPPGDWDFIQLFVTSRSELEAQLKDLKPALKPGGLLWVTYPKGTSKIKADINRDTINQYARSIGLQGVAMISVDDTWSALRLKPV